ncbi:hypothetical protein Arub01_01270 [Actinomadura rubrobrunea]|uniref:CHAT domain-containing protein n=1 Tax=Actinomadura rubrobrunea TaxID=115335 RepID=A0A9W6PRY3_9ACTN|nr:CHAT domain-containing protein [Actinomadura rubrobrunea]GLW61883.1 hypothetical protein Arub01_01270 [Actinomadura rubrobrunea]
MNAADHPAPGAVGPARDDVEADDVRVEDGVAADEPVEDPDELIDELIDELRALVEQGLPEEHRFAALVELGALLSARYARDGDAADRDEAITALRMADDAPAPPEAEPAWARLELARLLADRGERDGSVDDLEAAIRYSRDALAELPQPDRPDARLASAYCTLGISHFLRSLRVPAESRAEVRLAEEALRRSVALLPDGHPAAGLLTGRLGIVLAAGVQEDISDLDPVTPGNEQAWRDLADRSAAVLDTLDEGLRDMPADDPYRPLVRYWQAMTHALRFLHLGAGEDDRDAALKGLEALLDQPECDGDAANACHLFIAFLRLYRSAPAEFRRGGHAPDLRNVARVLAAGGVTDPQEARVALEHLEQVTESDPMFRAMAPSLRAMATLAAGGTELTDEHYAQAVAHLDRVAGEEDGADELRGLGDLLRSVQAIRHGGPENLKAAAERIMQTVEALDERHPVREALRGVTAQLLDRASTTRPTPDAVAPEDREAALELLEHVLRELPEDHPDRAFILLQLSVTLARNLEHRYSPERLRTVRELLREAVARPAADRENEAVNQFLLILVDAFQSMLGGDEAPSMNDLIERVKRVSSLLPPGHQLRRMAAGLLTPLLAQRFSRRGGLENLDAAVYYARRMVEDEDLAEDGGWKNALRWFLAASPMFKAQYLPEPDRIGEAAEALEGLAASLPEDDEIRHRVERDAGALASWRRLVDAAAHGLGLHGRSVQIQAERLAEHTEALLSARNASPESPFYAAEFSAAGNAKVLHGIASRNMRLVDEGLAMAADAYRAADALSPLRSQLLFTFGTCLFMRYTLSGDRADLDGAIDRLEEALRSEETSMFGTATPLILNSLAHAYHLRGDANLDDRRRAAETGLASLRARARGVMLQSSTERAFDAAVAASGEAAEVARFLVDDGLAETAVEALEWGRAMVLHTATTDVGLPALLREGGLHDLADEWEAASSEPVPAPWETLAPGLAGPPLGDLLEAPIPSDLRERVMAAIEGTRLERRLFSPAVPAEIAAALRGAGAAALAYLVPHGDGSGGFALVVDAGGRTRRIALPRLATGPGSRVEAFVEAQRDRWQADPESPEGRRARDRWRSALGDLCDWAWTAAMQPLLDAVVEAPGRAPRLVLVPVGELGAVPWHAARRTVADGAPRHACQDALITYAASARQFVEARRAEPRPWGSAPALVRVGGSGLYWSSKEVEQIHRRHYADGELLGGRRRASGRRSRPATAANVLALLPGPESAGASLLHLGCHAWSAPRPVDSHLRLAGDEVLGMTEILRQARSRPPGAAGGLVVLAACGSDLTGRHHDEALTLATAFAAAGAVGVVGARWPVDDLPTLLFMTMFHHYLNAGYADPAVALRAAQSWMLNPRRSVPASVEADLAGLDAAALAEPETWAAFTYQGR